MPDRLDGKRFVILSELYVLLVFSACCQRRRKFGEIQCLDAVQAWRDSKVSASLAALVALGR